MTDQPEILAIIPARGGSKGIPRKNVQPVLGKPLIAHTIEHALSATYVTRTVVSTDDKGIAGVARAFDAKVVMRPPELATDTATSESALRHVLDSLRAAEGYDPDLIVFLQATAPIRRPFDVDRAIATLQAAGADSLLSVVPSHSFLWRHTGEGSAEPVNYDYRSRPRRQDLEPQYAENGSIYVFKPWVLREHDNRLGGKIVLYEMDAWSGIDIDAPHDLALCEWIMSRRLGQKG
jgi:CMP-N,N'-diacetyllegionaminic acid synthase